MKKKILCILHLPPPVHGASMVGKYIQDSIIINDSFDCTYINLSTSQDLDDLGKNGFRKVFTILKVIWNVLKVLLSKKIDLCYITINSKGAAFYKEMVIVFLLKSFRCKIVYHYHNKGVKQGQKNFLLDKLYRLQFKNSKVILLSPLLFSDIARYIQSDKVYYCANGIPDVSGIELESIIKSRLSKDIPEILFLSNMMEEKGVFTLLDACKLLNDKNIIFKANFIGATADVKESDFNSYAKAKLLEDRVFYLGKKYNEEKARYFKNADIFVFPTYYHNEVFPLVNLEAMQYGLPIISTNEGAIRDAVEDGINGFIIPAKEPRILAEKIEYLIKNVQIRTKMGEKGRQIFEERYALEKFEHNFCSVLKNVLDAYEFKN